MSSSQLTNSIIFQRGRYTTNQFCMGVTTNIWRFRVPHWKQALVLLYPSQNRSLWKLKLKPNFCRWISIFGCNPPIRLNSTKKEPSTWTDTTYSIILYMKGLATLQTEIVWGYTVTLNGTMHTRMSTTYAHQAHHRNNCFTFYLASASCRGKVLSPFHRLWEAVRETQGTSVAKLQCLLVSCWRIQWRQIFQGAERLKGWILLC
jgi:hypothetical protein